MNESIPASLELTVLMQRDGQVVTISLNVPQSLNALDFAMAEALEAALDKAATDPSVRVLLLKGNGKAFMSGGDLKVFMNDLDHAPETADRIIPIFHRIVERLRSMPIPVVVSVHGAVAGGGLSLAMAGDILVSAQTTRFFPAYGAIGTSPDGGTSWAITQLLGQRRALAVLMLGEPITAQQALELGMINFVVPDAELEQRSADIVARLVAGAPKALANIKDLVNCARSQTLHEHLKLEHRYFREAAATQDFREGITAFFERRKPDFRGN
ncbi:MAG: enoyl-CoA hydratase-related protein [Pseudomonadota bacterium]